MVILLNKSHGAGAYASFHPIIKYKAKGQGSYRLMPYPFGSSKGLGKSLEKLVIGIIDQLGKQP